jgi:hypothetical protein
MEVEEKAIKFLENHDIYPFSVFFTDIIGSGALSITFYIEEDLNEFLNLLDYKNLCDTSGYDIFPEDRTILLTGRGLMNYYLL